MALENASTFNKQSAPSGYAGALSRRVANTNQYDLKRQELEAQSNREKEQAVKQAGASAIQRGFGQGSGIMEGQQRAADLEARRQLGSRLGAVDIQELTAEEAKQEAERQREYGTSERLGTQEFASTEAQKGREFTSSERMGTQDFTARQNDLNREIDKMGLNLKERELAQSATQFESRMEFDKYALEAGLTDKEADRAWNASESAKERTFKGGESEKGREAEITLTNLNNDLATGRMTLQNVFDMDKEERGIKIDSAHAAGASGAPMNPNWSESEKSAYEAGKNGESLEQAHTKAEDNIALRNTLISRLPDDANFRKNVEDILKQLDSGTFLSGSKNPPPPSQTIKGPDGKNYVITANPEIGTKATTYTSSDIAGAGDLNKSAKANAQKIIAKRGFVTPSELKIIQDYEKAKGNMFSPAGMGLFAKATKALEGLLK
jgi:hypothetical protein